MFEVVFTCVAAHAGCLRFHLCCQLDQKTFLLDSARVLSRNSVVQLYTTAQLNHKLQCETLKWVVTSVCSVFLGRLVITVNGHNNISLSYLKKWVQLLLNHLHWGRFRVLSWGRGETREKQQVVGDSHHSKGALAQVVSRQLPKH